MPLTADEVKALQEPLLDFDDPTMEHRLWEGECKARTLCILADPGRRIIVPDFEEWAGIGLLERDDQLNRRVA
jgi:hypothetical protein